MRILKRSFIYSIIVFSILISKTHAEEYSSIKMYFVRWNIKTRVTLTPSAVRNWRQLYMEINDEYMISIVSNAVFKKKFSEKKFGPPGKGAANLVIDFITKKGDITTIYANNGYMVNEKTNMYKKMDHNMIKEITSILNIDDK